MKKPPGGHFRVFGALGQFGEIGAKYIKSRRDTQKLIQIFQHQISCQMRPYSSKKAKRSNYTYFWVFRA